MTTLYFCNQVSSLVNRLKVKGTKILPLTELDNLPTLLTDNPSVTIVKVDMDSIVAAKLNSIFMALIGSTVHTLFLGQNTSHTLYNLNEIYPPIAVDHQALAQSPLKTLYLRGGFNEEHFKQFLPGIQESQIENLAITGVALRSFNDLLSTVKPGKLRSLIWQYSLPSLMMKRLDINEVIRFFNEAKRLHLEKAGLPLQLHGDDLIRALRVLQDSNLSTLYVPLLVETNPTILKAAVAKTPITSVKSSIEVQEEAEHVKALDDYVKRRVFLQGHSFSKSVGPKGHRRYLIQDVISILAQYMDRGTPHKDGQHFQNGFNYKRSDAMALTRQNGIRDLSASVSTLKLTDDQSKAKEKSHRKRG